MTGNPRAPRAPLDRLADALVEDVFRTSDEDVLAEFREGHGGPEQHAAEMRSLFEKSLVVTNKRRLAAAKEGVAASRQDAATLRRVIDMAEARARLRSLLGAPGVSQKLTLAARKESELSDDDVLGMLDDLRQLGVLTPDDSEGDGA